MGSRAAIRSVGAFSPAKLRSPRLTTPMSLPGCPRARSAIPAKMRLPRCSILARQTIFISSPTEPAATPSPPARRSRTKTSRSGARSSSSGLEALRFWSWTISSGTNPRSRLMALISMTGYADAHGGREMLRWRWEARSVNARGLDLRMRTPPGFESIEPAARVLANERFRRGSIQATLAIEPQDSTRGIRVDPVALAAAVKIAKEIQLESGLAPARVDGLLALKGVIVQDETLPLDADGRVQRAAAVLETLAAAFDSLARARATEGAKLEQVLKGLISDIARLTADASRLSATQPEAIKARMLKQLEDLQVTSVPDERVSQEVALLAVRADVREELDRLEAHVTEARSLLQSKEPIGRKLDFLAQEFNREANTLCSKSSDIQLTRIGLSLKASIDQLREQAQNVE